MVTESKLRALVTQALPADIGLTSLQGFKLDLSANRGFLKVFFSAPCDCGTTGLLSVEVAEDKTPDEVRRVLPSLIAKLEGQAKSFYGMPCEIHRRMRLGPAAGR